MPIYTNVAPAEPRGPALPIRRTPAHTALVAIVTADDLIGCYTHFWKGKTMPCERHECEACEHGIPYRWHAYLSAVDTRDGLHFIFECTAQASEHFTTYRNAHGSLRGCCFEARRLNNRPNGRILIRSKPADLTKQTLPAGPDLTQCLAILWSLPMPQVQTDHIDPERNMPTVTINPEDQRRVEKLRDLNLPTDYTAEPRPEPSKPNEPKRLLDP